MAVAKRALPQVSAQALCAFYEYPTQKKVHCFIVVDAYYVRLEYNRSKIPRLDASTIGDITKLAKRFRPTFSSLLLPALYIGGETPIEDTWFTDFLRKTGRSAREDSLRDRYVCLVRRFQISITVHPRRMRLRLHLPIHRSLCSRIYHGLYPLF